MNRRMRARLASGLAILAGGAGMMTQALPDQAILFFTLSLGIALCAMVIVFSKEHASWWTLGIAAFTSAAMTFTLTSAAVPNNASAQDMPALPAFVASSATYPVADAKPATVSASLDSATATRLVEHAAEQQNQYIEMRGSDQSRVLEAAKASGYKLRSGFTPDFSTAHVYKLGDGKVIASVQLKGTNAPEMSRVSYLYAGGKLVVIETASQMLNANNVSLKMWTDGQLLKNVVITRPGSAASDVSVQNVGLNWSRLNSCLSNAGVVWWVLAALSVLCGVACVTLVLCAPCIAAEVGGLGGMAAACVKIAWT